MNRSMAEARASEPEDEAPDAGGSWFEEIGEMLGDFLAEPSPGQVFIAILAIFLIFALALAFAIR